MTRCAAVLVLLSLVACATGVPTDGAERLAPMPNRYRADGARLPAFSGEDPAERGWVKVDDLIWVEAEHAARLEQGFIHDGTQYVSVAEGLPEGVSAIDGYRMRTDHVSLLTNLAWSTAVEVAREAEGHVTRFFARYGETLDIRAPDGPLRVIVTARRAELTALLQARMTAHVSWAAFYDAREGAVYLSREPAPAGALPWVADLRHEMTHQILDLARPLARRERAFGDGWFWLWEGIAIQSETLGDPVGTDSGALRIARFMRRVAADDITPLSRLFHLDVTRFEGRHYDETGSFMRFLMGGSRRSATLWLVRNLLRRSLPASELAVRLDGAPPVLEREWLSTIRR